MNEKELESKVAALEQSEKALAECQQIVKNQVSMEVTALRIRLAECQARAAKLLECAEAWKLVAEDQYAKLRTSLYGQPDYPVSGSLNAWAKGRYPATGFIDQPQDDTALRDMLDDARRPFYHAMGRDFQHLEPEQAMSAWADALKAEAKCEALNTSSLQSIA